MKFLKSKKFWSLLGAVGLLSSISLTVVSCSNTILNKYIKNSISKGNGNMFYDNGDLQSIAKRALLSTDGRTEALSVLANRVSLKIIEAIAKDKEGYQFKGDLESQKKKIDNEYNDLIKKYKKDHGTNAWALRFQQDILDPVGGTEESYKDDKLLSWANTYIVEKAFNTIYLTLIKDGQKYTPSSKTDLENILSDNGSKITYEFNEKYISSRTPNVIDKVMAKLQQIIFEGWYKIENPFVISTATWKYGNPKNGISSIYSPAKDSTTSKDEQGNETSTPNSASYEFPYFGNENETNTMEGEVTRFSKFLEASKTSNNFSQDGSTQNNYGLKKIDNKYNNSEETSTYKLVKASSIFKDININQAAAASYLYGRANQSVVKVDDHDEVMKKSLKGLDNSSDYLGFDKITGEFISNSRTTYTNNNTYFRQEIKLDSKLVSKIVNSKGPLKSNASKELYVVDGFIPSNKELNEYMFVRDDKGVSIIGIDGDDYLKQASSVNDEAQKYESMRKRSLDIVMYRYFENKLDNTIGFSFDVNKELSTFFTSNFALVMLEFANSQKSTPNIFGEQVFNIDTNIVELIKKLIDFNYAKSKYKNYNDFNKSLYDAKKKYMSNYGDYSAADNGLASPFPMPSYHHTDINSGYDFEFARLSSNLLDSKSSEKAIQDRYKSLSDEVNKYISAKQLTPLKSNFEGFKYSQYVYSNDLFINKVLKAYSTTTKESDFIKINALAKNIQSKFDVSKLETKFFSDADMNTGIEWGLSNYFYGTEFNKTDNNRWQYYKLLTYDASSKDKQFSVDELNAYRKKLWNYEITTINYDGYDRYLSLYTTLATINYLIENDYKEFLNYLSQNIKLGQSAYLVWSNSYNSSLETATTSGGKATEKSIKEILDVSKINQNVNNSYQDNYFGTTDELGDKTITNNVWSGATFNDNNNYYNIAGNMLGFYGIQTSTNNSLPTVISNELFTNPKNNNTSGLGILYGFENKQNLINHVNELTSIISVDDFAKKLAKETKTFDANSVLNQAVTLNEKKKLFVTNINNTSQIKNEYFQTRNNYVGSLNSTTANKASSYSTIVDPENSLLRHGAYAIQLNASNIKTYSALETQIKTGLSSTMNTKEDTSIKDTKNIIGNLIVKAATDINVQKDAINKIAANNKINVFDVNIYKQLGSAWIKNWKNIN